MASQTIDLQELEAIKARLAAASPGNWTHGRCTRITTPYIITSDDEEESIVCEVNNIYDDAKEVADFIANAPNDIRWLIEQLENALHA